MNWFRDEVLFENAHVKLLADDSQMNLPRYGSYQAIQYARYVWHHHVQETKVALESDPDRFERIRKLAREAFAKTFGECGCCAD